MRRILEENRLELALLNTAISPQANFHIGLGATPHRKNEFIALIRNALDYASNTQAKIVHVMAGEFDNTAENHGALVANLKDAGAMAADVGVALVIEPINSRDRPKWFLKSTSQALEIIAEVDLPAVKLLFDVYHVQILEGDLTRRLEASIPQIGHVQIAGVPLRHEPDQGEVNYFDIFEVLDRIAYDGWIGCEYTPRAGTEEGLRWADRFGISAERAGSS